MTPHDSPGRRVGFLGPHGTFAEQALLTQADLAEMDLVAFPTVPDILAAVEGGEVLAGFVPIENSLEGSVNVTVDSLAFTVELLIQREVVLDVQLDLMAPPGRSMAEVRRVLSHPHGLAECRAWVMRELPGAVEAATSSTAEAARLVAEDTDGDSAAVANPLAGKLYGLSTLASNVADHPENQTRFVLVARAGVPTPTGHDKTSIVVFQREDAPGSLLSILQEFAARRINLSKLESRPTKQGLGSYCFLIDLDGHVADAVVADALRELYVKQGGVKFMGSYPAAGEGSTDLRREATEALAQAEAWLAAMRGQVGASPLPPRH